MSDYPFESDDLSPKALGLPDRSDEVRVEGSGPAPAGPPFILPGTTDPAICAVCGSQLVGDEDRETGWRCPNEANHGEVPAALREAAQEFLDAYVDSERTIAANDIERLDEAEIKLRAALRGSVRASRCARNDNDERTR